MDIYELFALAILGYMCFLTAMRADTIGTDTKEYIGLFRTFNESPLQSGVLIEIGWQMYMKAIGVISKNPHFFLLFHATISYLLLGWIIIHYSHDIVFSCIFSFTMFFSMFSSVMRQSTTVLLVAFIYYCVEKRKRVEAIVILLLAILLHRTAAIAILFFFYKVIPKNKMIIIFTSALFLFWGVSRGLVPFFMMVIPTPYQRFFGGRYYDIGLYAVLFNVLCALIFLKYVYKYFEKENIKTNNLLLWNGMLFLYTSLLGFTSNIFTRLSKYFLMVDVIELPRVVDSNNYKNERKLFISITLFVYFFGTALLRSEWSHIVPYQYWK